MYVRSRYLTSPPSPYPPTRARLLPPASTRSWGSIIGSGRAETAEPTAGWSPAVVHKRSGHLNSRYVQ
ncbi:hypothetical protein VTK26DRAFT_4984 [Humicola hyalothermophila]